MRNACRLGRAEMTRGTLRLMQTMISFLPNLFKTQLSAPSISPFTATLPPKTARFQGYVLGKRGTKTKHLPYLRKSYVFITLVLLLTFSLPNKSIQEMVEGWRRFTTSEFDVELVQGNHLFVYNADVRDSWFESITDLLTGEGF